MKRRSSSGVALVVTLMMMSVLVMMVVGLAGVMRNEQAAARNLTYQVLAQQMAEIGVQEAMATVLSNSPTNGTYSATGPGWMISNRTSVPLFSRPQPTTAGSKNLEQIGTNSLILSLRDVDRGTLQASWVTVVPPGGNTNVPVGRYAWWVDDEGTKANLNAMGGTNTNLLGMITAFPLSQSAVFKNSNLAPETANWVRGTNLLTRSNAFPTPESLKDTNLVVTDTNTTNRRLIYRRNKGHLTVWSSNVDRNPWGQPKIALTNLSANITNPTMFDNLMSKTFANSNLTNNLFSRDFVDKYGNGNRAVGSNVIRQILASAYEAVVPSNSTGRPLSDATGTNLPTNYLGVSPRMAHLNEAPVAVTYHARTNTSGVNPNSLQLQIWVQPEILGPGLTPTPSGLDTRSLSLVMQMSNVILSCETPDALGGVTTNYVVREKTGFWDAGNSNSTVINGSVAGPPTKLGGNSAPPNVVPGFYTNRTWAVFEYTFRDNDPNPAAVLVNAGFARNLQVTVRLGRLILYQRFAPALPAMAVDWIDPVTAAQDLVFSGTAVRTNAAITFSFGTGTTIQSMSASANSAVGLEPPAGLTYLGFSKTDPRARAFSGWTSGITWNPLLWRSADGTPGLENTNLLVGTLPGGLIPDTLTGTISATNQGKVWYPTTNHTGTISNGPAWVFTINRATNQLSSVALLGWIHTGLPWRTLRLSSQTGSGGGPADPDPPDWILLDLFSASADPGGVTQAAPRINPNIWILHAGGATNRLSMVPALMASLTNTDSWLDPLDRWTAADYSTATNRLLQTNIPWISGSTWSTRRAGAGLPENRIFFTGELMEVEGVGNVGGTDAKREAAAAALGDMVNPRSDTFSVWSIGQGLGINTNASPFRTNVMGEIRRQTVFQRVPLTDANGAIINHQVRVLYSREHTLE